MKSKKKIAYISGTRADFGLMTPILKAIDISPNLSLQMYATGAHLMNDFGLTFKQVKKEFPGTKKIEAVFDYKNQSGMANFTGQYLTKLTATLNRDKPDIVLTLGDRVEMLCTAVACLYLGIPTAHIHGGEKTSTADEIARHAITKLSHIHFPATDESAERIRKLGEDDWRIHVVGAPALDIILNEKLPRRAELFKELGLDPAKKVILLTQHPVSEEIKDAKEQIRKTVQAVKKSGLQVVVIYPHADTGGNRIISEIEKMRSNPLFRIFPSLEYRKFLALEREASVWVGNSSGALIESSSFKTPVVNIGTRQKGRQHGENVINVGYNSQEISVAINRSLNDNKYLQKLAGINNPWGDGRTGPRVAKILENTNINARLLTKQVTY